MTTGLIHCLPPAPFFQNFWTRHCSASPIAFSIFYPSGGPREVKNWGYLTVFCEKNANKCNQHVNLILTREPAPIFFWMGPCPQITFGLNCGLGGPVFFAHPPSLFFSSRAVGRHENPKVQYPRLQSTARYAPQPKTVSKP